ncbi:MAG: hypothetical protein N7Q72_05820 [Spiroplasma sp. Tabriz.8]|nr:hypothetical protein [Spiroplasma sp. Tabriz.8]
MQFHFIYRFIFSFSLSLSLSLSFRFNKIMIACGIFFCLDLNLCKFISCINLH